MPRKRSSVKSRITRDHKPQIKRPVAKTKVLSQDAFVEIKRAARTADGFDNFVSRLGLNNDNTLSAGFYTLNLLTRNRIQLEAAYRGSWVVGRVIDSIPEDMTRAGIEITTSEEDEDIDEIQNAISRLQVWQSLKLLAKWGRLYGGAIGVIQIKGQKLDTPLDLDTVDKDQFQGIVVYDRWQLNPILVEVIDSGPETGLPTFYAIVNNPTSTDPSKPSATGQMKVHHSRCIRYTGIDLPWFQAITEMMWGESVLERLWDRLISFDNAALSCASLIDRANLRTVSIDKLRELISAGGQSYEGLIQFFELMNQMQNNMGLTLLDKEDVFQTTSYTFAGLSDMMLQFGQQLAGAAETPLVRLFGQSPSGLSATGESDMRMYYDQINSQQESKYRNAWEVLLKVLWRSTFGKPAPEDLQFKFRPLWQMTETDKANNAKTVTETILGAFENNVIDKPTAMTELRDKSGDTGLFASITDEQIKEAEEEPPPMPDEAMPGAPTDKPPAAQQPNDPAKKPVKSLDHATPPYKKIWKWLSKR